MLVVHVPLDEAALNHFCSFSPDWAPPRYRPLLKRKTHPAAYAQSIAGLWLLHKALEHPAGSSHRVAGLHFGAHGQPQLPAGPVFSISHSDRHVACAVSDTTDGSTAVGLDIEQPRPLPAARINRLACNDPERSLFAQQPSRFFDYWCAREATVKATGRVGLKRIRQIELEGDKARLDGHCWALYPLSLASDLTACLACDHSDEQIEIRQLTPT